MHVMSDKCQTKAMKVAAAVSGVESVTLAGGDKSLLLVIGTAVDSNKLVKKLKKKVGEAEIVELRTHDTFEPAALPLPGTKQEAAAARSPYGHSHLPRWQHNAYAAAPPLGAGGSGPRRSGYSMARAQSHPANYSPLVERHEYDYQPMDHDYSSSSSNRKQSTGTAVSSNNCAIL